MPIHRLRVCLPTAIVRGSFAAYRAFHVTGRSAVLETIALLGWLIGFPLAFQALTAKVHPDGPPYPLVVHRIITVVVMIGYFMVALVLGRMT